MTFQQFDSRNLIISCHYPKWAEEGRKRNDYRLSIPSIFLFTSPPTFHVPLTFTSSSLFCIFPTTWEHGTGYSQPVCRVWQVHAQLQNCSIACDNCKTKWHEAFPESLSLPVLYSLLCNTALKWWASLPSLIVSYLYNEASWWLDNKIVQDSREIDSYIIDTIEAKNS